MDNTSRSVVLSGFFTYFWTDDVKSYVIIQKIENSALKKKKEMYRCKVELDKYTVFL